METGKGIKKEKVSDEIHRLVAILSTYTCLCEDSSPRPYELAFELSPNSRDKVGKSKEIVKFIPCDHLIYMTSA